MLSQFLLTVFAGQCISMLPLISFSAQDREKGDDGWHAFYIGRNGIKNHASLINSYVTIAVFIVSCPLIITDVEGC